MPRHEDFTTMGAPTQLSEAVRTDLQRKADLVASELGAPIVVEYVGHPRTRVFMLRVAGNLLYGRYEGAVGCVMTESQVRHYLAGMLRAMDVLKPDAKVLHIGPLLDKPRSPRNRDRSRG